MTATSSSRALKLELCSAGGRPVNGRPWDKLSSWKVSLDMQHAVTLILLTFSLFRTLGSLLRSALDSETETAPTVRDIH